MRHVKRGLTLTRSCDVSAQSWLGRKIHMPPPDDSISAASNHQKMTGRMRAYTVRHCSCLGDFVKTQSFQCISAFAPKEFRSLKLGINPATHDFEEGTRTSRIRPSGTPHNKDDIMQFIKSVTLIASLALALSACHTKDDQAGSVAFDALGATTETGALASCDSWWGWFTGNCEDTISEQQRRCEGLTNAPGRDFEGPGTWDAEKRACVNKWPSPICYGLLMNSCEDTGNDATHQCSSWNVACRTLCGKWNGMRFAGYCSQEWWDKHP